MRETWVLSLSWEDPLGKEMAIHSSTIAWKIPWTVHGLIKSLTQLSDLTHSLSVMWLSTMRQNLVDFAYFIKFYILNLIYLQV